MSVSFTYADFINFLKREPSAKDCAEFYLQNQQRFNDNFEEFINPIINSSCYNQLLSIEFVDKVKKYIKMKAFL